MLFTRFNQDARDSCECPCTTGALGCPGHNTRVHQLEGNMAGYWFKHSKDVANSDTKTFRHDPLKLVHALGIHSTAEGLPVHIGTGKKKREDEEQRAALTSHFNYMFHGRNIRQ